MAGLELEMKRRGLILDMMLTGHSRLRDRYRSRALALDILLLTVSVFLLLTAIMDPLLLRRFGMNAEVARAILGLLSAVAFLASVIQLRVDWKELGGEHARAASTLAILKARCRELRQKTTSLDEAACASWLKEADQAMALLPPIPESQFAAMKSAHRLKVEISKLLDKYPGAPPFILRWKLRTRSAIKALKSAEESKLS
jgi:hypothetical protein